MVFILQANNITGALELLYHVYLLALLGCWILGGIFLLKRNYLRSSADWFLLAYLIWATLTLGLTIINGGIMREAIAEWLPLSLFAFYYIFKDIAYRSPHRINGLLAALGVLAAYLALDNFVEYYVDLTSATEMWRLMVERVRDNEPVLIISALGSLCYFLYAKASLTKYLSLGLALLMFGSIIITQSRTLWVATLLGVGIIYLSVRVQAKKRLLVWSFIGLLCILVLFAILLRDYFFIISSSLIERAGSLQTATSQDISLLNRFNEWSAAWEKIKHSPFIGYGFGVQYHFFDLTREATMVKSHIHNMYIGISYRHGLIGLSLIIAFFILVFKNAWFLLQAAKKHPFKQKIAAFTLSSMVCLLLMAMTESPMIVDPGTLAFAFVAGISNGLWENQQAISTGSGKIAS